MKKKSLLCLLGILFAFAFAAGVGRYDGAPTAAEAAPFIGEEDDVTVTENCAPYEYLKIAGGDYGCKLTFSAAGAVAEFSQPIELSGATELIRLSMLPSAVSTAAMHADLGSFTVRIEQEDDEDTYVEITVNTMVDVFQSVGYSAVYAQASGQSVAAGEAGQSFGTAEAGYDGTDWIRTFGGNVKAFSFADINSNTLSLYYDSESNRVYTGTAECQAGYGPTVRRLSHAYTDPIPTSGNTYGFVNDENTFAGFEAGKRVKLSVIAGSLVNGASTAEMLVYSVGGSRTVSPLTASAPSLAVEGGTYSVPVPVSYLSGKPVDVSDASYTVTGPDGGQVSSGTVADAQPFAVATAGTYTIAYESGDNTASLTVNAVSAEEAASLYPLQFTDIPDEYTGRFIYPAEGGAVTLRAEAESGLDTGASTVSVTAVITKDNAEEPEATLPVAADGSTRYTPEEEGAYTVVYTATDYTGRTAVSEPVTFTSAWAQVGFDGGVTAADAVPIGADSPLLSPSAGDIVVFDPRCAGMTDEYVSVTVSVKAPSAQTFTAYTPAYAFDELGVYEIRYDFSYAFGTVSNASSAVRRLTVYDGTPPTLIPDGLPGNTAAHPTAASTDSNIWLKAKAGLGVRLPEMRAADTVGMSYDLSAAVTYCEIAPDGTVTDRTAEYRAAAGYTFTPAEAGVYVLRFTVTDSAGLCAVLNYSLDVRDYWYSIRPAREIPSATAASSGISVPQASVTDFFGAAVEGGELRVELYAGDTLADGAAAGKTFVNLTPGVYRVEYTYSRDGETAVYTAEINVTDDILPVISLTGGDRSGVAGRRVALPTYTATDNDLLASSSVRVLYEEAEINYYDGAFRPSEAGEYTVVVTATDVSGNTAEVRYTVSVAAAGLPGWAIALIVIGAVAVAAAAAIAVVMVVRIKRRRGGEQKESA